MNTGLLWYDATRPLPVKIAQAAARLQERCGLVANCVHLPPQDVPPTDNADKEPPTLAGCILIPDQSILPHHLWIGRKEPAAHP